MHFSEAPQWPLVTTNSSFFPSLYSLSGLLHPALCDDRRSPAHVTRIRRGRPRCVARCLTNPPQVDLESKSIIREAVNFRLRLWTVFSLCLYSYSLAPEQIGRQCPIHVAFDINKDNLNVGLMINERDLVRHWTINSQGESKTSKHAEWCINERSESMFAENLALSFQAYPPSSRPHRNLLTCSRFCAILQTSSNFGYAYQHGLEVN